MGIATSTALLLGGLAAGAGTVGAAALAKPKGPTKEQEAISNEAMREQLELAKREEARTSEMYGLGLPLVKQAVERQQKIAASPFLGAAPGIEQAARNTYDMEGLLKSDLPRGGGQELALAMNRLNLGRQAADLTTAAREGAYGSLAGMGTDLLNRTSSGTTASTLASLLPKQQESNSALTGILGGAASTGSQALMTWLLNRQPKPSSGSGGWIW